MTARTVELFVEGASNPVLLDYHQHQRRLFPLVAKVLAAGFAHDELLEAFDGVFSGRNDTDESRQDLETMAAALKATSTRLALDSLQECREACGGAGFLSENRLTGLRADLDVYATFEGDNTVLMQLVAKRLLGDFAKGISSLPAAGKARWAASRAAFSSGTIGSVAPESSRTGVAASFASGGSASGAMAWSSSGFAAAVISGPPPSGTRPRNPGPSP